LFGRVEGLRSTDRHQRIGAQARQAIAPLALETNDGAERDESRGDRLSN
jgi:hypothetical protein